MRAVAILRACREVGANSAGERFGLSPGFVTEFGFSSLYCSSKAPGGATTSKVGFGM